MKMPEAVCGGNPVDVAELLNLLEKYKKTVDGHRNIVHRYYTKNRPSILEKQRERYIAEKAKVNAKYREYYEKNKTEIQRRRKERRQARSASKKEATM